MPGNKKSSNKKRETGNGAHFAGAILSGIGPRSNSTAKVHRLFRDGHATESEFKEAMAKDSMVLLEAQKGYAYVSGGQLDWLDIMRPLARCFAGFAARSSSGEDAVGPVTRWFRTNTFYRKPLISEKIECEGNELAGMLPSNGKSSILFILAPYSFANLVENSFYEDKGALALDYAKAIAKSSKKLQEKGYACVFMAEPFVGYELSLNRFKEPEWYSKAVSKAKAEGVKLGINYPLAEASSIVPLAESTDADFIGIDAVFTSNFSIITKKDIFIGVVDGARAGVEASESISNNVKAFIDGAGFSNSYYIGPNDRLYDVPFEIAIKKAEALSGFKGVR